MRTLAVAVAAAFALALAGCASSHVITGTVRPAIPPEQVKVYTTPPKKYEQVAIIDASSRRSFSFGDQAKVNAAITRLKEEAAKLGANGVLLQGVGTAPSGSVSFGFGGGSASGNTAVGAGVGTSGTTTMKTAKGLAIYVTEE